MAAQEKKYKSGMRLVVDSMPNSKSVSFNMYFKVGSRNEVKEEEFGISHFIEHMLHKSTENYTTSELHEAFDKLGLSPNAYTSVDATNYHIKTINSNLEKCVSLMSDMLFHAKFDEEDFKIEKNVILQELAQSEANINNQSLQDYIFTVFKDSPLAHPIIGYKDTVENMQTKDLKKYYKKHYIPSNLILSFAGDITMEKAEELAEKYFQKNFNQIATPNYADLTELETPTIPSDYFVYNTLSNQANITITIPSVSLYSDKHDALLLFSIALSNGFTSPLFKRMREEKGLVYSIYSYLHSYPEGGHFNINFSVSGENVVKSIHEISKLMKEIKENGITKEELDSAKNVIKNEIIFSYDSTSLTAKANALELATYNKIESTEENLARYNNITLEEVNKVAKELFSNEKVNITNIGPELGVDLLDEFLKDEKERFKDLKRHYLAEKEKFKAIEKEYKEQIQIRKKQNTEAVKILVNNKSLEATETIAEKN